jgi:hypothetical protein
MAIGILDQVTHNLTRRSAQAAEARTPAARPTDIGALPQVREALAMLVAYRVARGTHSQSSGVEATSIF